MGTKRESGKGMILLSIDRLIGEDTETSFHELPGRGIFSETHIQHTEQPRRWVLVPKLIEVGGLRHSVFGVDFEARNPTYHRQRYGVNVGVSKTFLRKTADGSPM
jgi:hypothetical protein